MINISICAASCPVKADCVTAILPHTYKGVEKEKSCRRTFEIVVNVAILSGAHTDRVKA